MAKWTSNSVLIDEICKKIETKSWFIIENSTTYGHSKTMSFLRNVSFSENFVYVLNRWFPSKLCNVSVYESEAYLD